MSAVTIVWSMIASASLTLAVIYLIVWYRNPRSWAHFFFAVTALAMTGQAFSEMWIMSATTPSELLAARTVMHVPLSIRVLAITWFVWFRLEAGRWWLAWTVCVLRSIALAGHVFWPPDISGITSVRRIEFLGEPVTVLSNLPNPMAVITQLSTILLLLFVADASVTAWRRGDRRKALLVGGSVELFLLAGFSSVLAIVWQGADIPMAFSMLYPLLLAVTAYELSHDVLRASQLVDELRASEAELRESERETGALREEIAHAGRVSLLGQLSAALAHEINQPLGAIRLNADAAGRFLNRPDLDRDELRTILKDISQESQRAGDVIDGMRNLLKRQSLNPKPLDIAGLVGEVSALVRVNAVARNVKLSVDVPRGLPLVNADRIHLQQVLINLVLNGMDALSDASPPNRRIHVSACLTAGAVEVAVADAGHGIPADKLATVFEPFFTTKSAGMGMGLPISRTIIQAHGGRIWAESVAGQGAAFRFTLPIAETINQETP